MTWRRAIVAKSEADFPTEALTTFERRFRAVLVADVVGYTRLMETAELETHTRYRALRVGVIDPTIVFHRGEIVKNTGDGFVAVFESPVDALGCATQLQELVGGEQARQPPERHIAFRMGAHWEPVIFDLNDVHGGGVNIAVRLQSVAPAGGIVISSALLAEAGDRHNFKVDDLGELHLKNLSRPIHAFSLRLPGVDRSAAVGAPIKHSGWPCCPRLRSSRSRTSRPSSGIIISLKAS
jgi:adenylate cyclase